MTLRSCATSSIVDIQVNPDDYEECTDPESRNGLNKGGKGNKGTNFGKVNSLESEFSETFTSVNVGLRSSRYTTAAKF